MSDRGRLSEDTGRRGGAPVIARKLRENIGARVAVRTAGLRRPGGRLIQHSRRRRCREETREM
jgi:hypothetical protein